MNIKRKRKITISKKERKQNVLRSNKQLYRIVQVMVLIGTLVVANVLFTMVTHMHVWSGTNVLNSSISSSIVDTALEASRGTIYDRNHEVIAQEVPAWTIVAYLDEKTTDENGDPDYVSDTRKTANALAKVLEDVKASEIKEILDTAIAQERSQTELGAGTKRLDEETKNAVEELDLAGIDFVETTNRYYPTTPFSSNLIGFATYDEDQQQIVGKLGLELTMDDILSGTDGRIRYQQTVKGDVLPGTTTIYEEAVDGNDVVLTLDVSLQAAVETAMEQTMELNNAESAWCVVMEVETGKILAWASYPTFDQNEHQEIPSYTDLVSEMIYEPGSVMKPFTYAAAVDTGTFPYNTYYRAGTFAYGYDTANNKINRVDASVDTGYPEITDALGNDYGTLTFEDGLAFSSNVAICELLANYMNYDSLENYLDKFGFFQATDIPYVNESIGVKNMDVPMGYLRTGFGQSSSITVLQLVQAYSAIFNDGVMVRPYVVESIEDSDTGEVLESYSTEVAGNPISEETADTIVSMMEHVLDEGMSGERFAIDGISMAAKTGTGEIYDPERGEYSTTYYTSSIIAASPAEDPKIMVYWGMVSPNYVDYSAQQFKDIMRAALVTYGLNTSNSGSSDTGQQETWESYTMPSLVNHSVEYASGKTESWKAQIVLIGNGSRIVSQSPAAGSTVNSQDRVFLLSDGDTITMPDMTGWTKKDVDTFASMSGIPITIEGSGVVSEQSTASGTTLTADMSISVKME